MDHYSVSMAGMDQTFVWKLLLSFLVGATWVTTVTVIAERFGSKIGGFIGGLPSTVVVALIFIGLTQGNSDASRAAVMIPLVMGVNGFFIMIYQVRIHTGLVRTILLALLVWFVIIGFVIWTGAESAFLSLLVWSLSLVLFYYLSEYVLDIGHKGGVRVPYTLKQILARGLVSGLIISTAVLISRLTGPVVGGVFANFPVIFMSTLYITYRTGGVEFSRAVAKTLMVSAMVNVGVYSFVVHFTYQHFNLFWGTAIGLLVTSISAGLTYSFLRRQVG
ncbi:MAG: DUF3147 family protein [Candidatus Marinimicrobia bacterium]|nr:DUF3147 family protein [Candidatus Neomarinimicrobiota bacterium]MCF7903888.1 DUF3147 family protein [Candidatus Neomarinimicrobiota bacterium]